MTVQKKRLLVVLVLVLTAALVAGIVIGRHGRSVIGRDRALEIALADAGFTRAQVRDVGARLCPLRGQL